MEHGHRVAVDAQNEDHGPKVDILVANQLRELDVVLRAKQTPESVCKQARFTRIKRKRIGSTDK